MKRIALPCTLLFSLLTAISANASLSIALDQKQMVSRAHAVFEGHVTDVRSHWNKEKTVIVTDTRVAVDDQVLGALPSEVIVRTIGGQVGDIRIEGEGTPSFERGQTVLLFLEKRPDGTFGVLGDQLGAYQVVTSSTGERMAVPTAEPGLRLISPDGKSAARPQTLPVEDLKNDLRELSIQAGKN